MKRMMLISLIFFVTVLFAGCAGNNQNASFVMASQPISAPSSKAEPAIEFVAANPVSTHTDNIHIEVEIDDSDLAGEIPEEPEPDEEVPIKQSDTIDPSKPMIALTFDDGPSEYTDQILDLLETYGARATFCVMGFMVESQRDTIIRQFEMGFEIIGHSWSHSILPRMSEGGIRAELLQTNEIIESIIGVSSPIYRAPYGSVNEQVKKVSRELGLSILNWSIDTNDWRHRDENLIYGEIMNKVKDGAIILSHDTYEATAKAMERVIPELIAQGYQLVTVSELVEYKNGGFEPGVVYTGRDWSPPLNPR